MKLALKILLGLVLAAIAAGGFVLLLDWITRQYV
jgi:hypothetical protein